MFRKENCFLSHTQEKYCYVLLLWEVTWYVWITSGLGGGIHGCAKIPWSKHDTTSTICYSQVMSLCNFNCTVILLELIYFFSLFSLVQLLLLVCYFDSWRTPLMHFVNLSGTGFRLYDSPLKWLFGMDNGETKMFDSGFLIKIKRLVSKCIVYKEEAESLDQLFLYYQVDLSLWVFNFSLLGCTGFYLKSAFDWLLELGVRK